MDAEPQPGVTRWTHLESLAMVRKMLLDEANTGDADHVWDAEREIAALRKRVEELEGREDQRMHDLILWKWKDRPGGHFCPCCDAPKDRGHYEGCEAPHADLMREVEKWHSEALSLAAVEKDLEGARGALDEAVGLLKEMEWSFDANNEYGRWCLLCDACSSFGSQKPPKRHEEGCPLAAFLEKYG